MAVVEVRFLKVFRYVLSIHEITVLEAFTSLTVIFSVLPRVGQMSVSYSKSSDKGAVFPRDGHVPAGALLWI